MNLVNNYFLKSLELVSTDDSFKDETLWNLVKTAGVLKGLLT